MDTLPDIFSKYSQGSAASKNSFKSKQKKCGKTIDDILGSAEPFEEKTEKKRKNKRTVDKFQEDAVKDFDWLSISNSHTLLSKEVHGSVESTNSFVTQIDDKKKEILGDFPKTVVDLRMENLTPEDPKYMEPKISERARSCHKDKTNDIVDTSCKNKLFFDEFNEEKVDKVIEEDLKGTFKTNKLPKIDTYPDIFSRSSQGSAMTQKIKKKIKKKKCRKTIDDILSSPEPFEEKTEKKRKNKKTVAKFQEDVKKDFDWLSISNSHTLLSKEIHGSVESTNSFVTQIDDKKKEILDDFPKTVVELRMENLTPENPKYMEPKISETARSCHKDETNDIVDKSCKQKLFFDEFNEEKVDKVIEEDLKGTFKTNKLPKIDTYPDIFSRSSQGSAMKIKKKIKKKKCRKTIDDILSSPEPFEEKTKKKRKNKKTVAKFQEDVKKDFDGTPISNSHTLLSKESEMSVQEDEKMFLRASLEEALERDAEMNVSLQEIHDEVLEEQIDDVIEEQIDEVVEEQIDEVIEVDMTGYNYQETVEALPEEVEEQCSVSSEDNYTPFSEEDEGMLLRASLEEALEREAEINVSLQEIYDEVIEEQIDEVIEVDMTGYNYQETVEALPEEVEEQRSVSSEDNYTPFSEGSEISVQEDKEMFLRASLQEALEREAETNASLQEALEREEETNVSLQEALEREEETNVSLQEALEREARTKASLEEALKKEKAQQEEILEQERKEKALEKTLREAEAEKDDLRAVIDLMKAQVADLMKSQMSHEKQKHTITAMTAELDESKKLIIELQKDLEASTLQHEKEMAERENVNCAQMKLLKEHLIQQQEKSLEKDNEIQSLNVKLQTLQMTIEAKDKIVSTLRKKVERSASDLKEEETKNSELKRDYEAILSQQQKDEEKQKHLIQENQKLISENKRLQNKLEGQLLQKVEEDIPVDKARFLTACKKIQMQKEELAEKTLALEKSLTAEKYLRSSLRKEKKRFDQMVFQNQTSAEPDTFLKNQLREASANSECLTYDMQTLRMDNADIRAKFSATEAEFDKLKSKYTSLSERYQEMMLEKNETISENQHTITKLQCKAQKLKSRFEGIINKERTKNSELQQKVDQISSALEKEKTMCEKQRVELMEASTKQMTTLEEKQKLSLALQKAQEKAFSFKEPLGVSSIQSRHNSNYEFMLKQQRISLDKSTAALNHLQKQNSDITSEHRELLKTHSTLKLKYDKLLYERGNLDKSTAALNHLQKQNSDITSEHRELLKTHSTLKLKYDKLLYERGNQSCVHFVPDYQPLDVFSVTAGDPGPVSWSEEDEICELAIIRLKEIELCNMIEKLLASQSINVRGISDAAG
ncbi:hypothetical protein D5F01_LYC10137 [Larimichthys crocea]|uniref:Uncharacterized protein n=1 Tax=Larimichthys crocea TaxID=215358 RepID=A0A6G0IH33_LARCR|nr:hypothetical protein D5F01_LYC10137 [Larimichthys crocea]